MNDDTFSIGLNAVEHIRFLVEKIGPRPAGSFSEKRALDYAAEQMIRFGYQPLVKPVSFAPFPAFFLENVLSGLILIAAGWVWPHFPAVTLLTPLLLLLMPELEKLETRLRPRSAQSWNVYAENEGAQDVPLIIFCAHADSAPAMALDHPFWVSLFAQGMRILQRIAILIALLSLVVVLGFSIPFPVYWPVGMGASLAGAWFALNDLINQLDHRKGYSPGAVDNASGVGMVLALAEYFAGDAAPKRLRLGFLITGAEETGLHGAEAFSHELVQMGGKVAVFNLDMVGAGNQVTVVTREGSLFSQETTRVLNNLLFEVYPPLRPAWYSLKSGDFAAFLRNGIDAVSLQTSEASGSETAYHTIRDNMSAVSLESLQLCAEVVCRFIEMLPYSAWVI